MTRTALVAILLASCGGETSLDFERHELGTLEYAIPDGWTSRDQSEHQTQIVVWAPSKDNDLKESIALLRTREMPAVTKSDSGRVQQWLSQAQRGLPDASFGAAKRFKSKHGLLVTSIEGAFVPAGSNAPYHRIHAVVADGPSLVHVIYTARTASHETFNQVLDSLIRKAS